MKRQIAFLLRKAKDTVEFQKRWTDEHPGDINHMKLHYLDGRIEALEELLALATTKRKPKEPKT